MRNWANILTLLLCCGFALATLRCQKSVAPRDVIHIHASRITTIIADGSSLDTIYADLNANAVPANRGVTFQAASGLFANGFDTMSVFANRTDITSGKITAVVFWHASLRAGNDTLSASTSTIPQFSDSLILSLTVSAVDSIQLIPSTYTLKDTFGMQLTLTGILLNASGGEPSIGGTVRFTDLTDAGTPAGGIFQPSTAGIDSDKVTTLYSPSLLTAAETTGRYVTIKAMAYDPNGNPTGRPGFTRIYISP